MNSKSRNAKLRLILSRDGNRCSICSLRVPTHERSLEHKIPKSLGGSDDTSNLTLAHKACNQIKSNFTDISNQEIILLKRLGFSKKFYQCREMILINKLRMKVSFIIARRKQMKAQRSYL